MMDPAAVGAALGQFGLHLPLPSADVLQGLADIGPLLVTAVPLGIYNFTEGMNNVESASAAGDDFSLRKVLIADGIGAMAGSILGSPFPPAVYIGHPGWKSVGGRIGYSMATGVVIAVVCFLGLTATAARGRAAGRDPADPALHRPRHRGAGVRGDADPPRPGGDPRAAAERRGVGADQVDGALAAAGTSAAQVGYDKLAANGVIYHGMQLFGGGATLAGLILGAIAAFIIDRRFDRAGLYALIGAVFAFFGFINGTALGFGNSSGVAVGYLLLAVICLICARSSQAVPVIDPVLPDGVAQGEPTG